jgi:Na+-driven multidrug efflux pump
MQNSVNQGPQKVVAAGDTAKEETEDIGKAIKEILKISIPQIIQLVTGLLMGIFNTAVIGHIGTERQMAGAGMALMILQVGCFGIIIGLNSALNTLIS